MLSGTWVDTSVPPRHATIPTNPSAAATPHLSMSLHATVASPILRSPSALSLEEGLRERVDEDTDQRPDEGAVQPDELQVAAHLQLDAT